MSSWLDELKVGDEVALDMSRSSMLQIRQIDRITPKQFVVGCMHFWRKDGSCTELNGGYRPSLLIPTPEIRESIRRQHLALYIANSTYTKLTMLPIDLLETVVRSLKALRP
jgi:hypothetical protein